MHNQPHDAATLTPSRAQTLDSAFRATANLLRQAGVGTPELDARLLVCHACGLSHERFAATPERTLSTSERRRLDGYAKRRCAREPVSRITGTREFRGLEFALGPDVLDPRPDTETLVVAALELAKKCEPAGPLSILDLGTGSGCILVSLLHEMKNAQGVGVDVSENALSIARENALRHGCAERVRFVCTSWTEAIAGQFDLVVSNPPYISRADLAQLEPEVRLYDPAYALDGGDDGLGAYRVILRDVARVCSPGAWVLLEVGEGQDQDVCAMIAEEGETVSAGAPRRWRDLAGRVRCVAVNHSPTP